MNTSRPPCNPPTAPPSFWERGLALLCRLALLPVLNVVGHVKDAMANVKVNTGIMLSMLGKVCWLTPLLFVPHLFQTNARFYSGFAVIPEFVWSLILLVLITIDLIALVRRSLVAQMGTLALGMFLWFFFMAMASHGVAAGWLGVPAAPSAIAYALGGIGCVVGMIFTGLSHQRERLAATLLAWRQFMDTQEDAEDVLLAIPFESVA